MAGLVVKQAWVERLCSFRKGRGLVDAPGRRGEVEKCKNPPLSPLSFCESVDLVLIPGATEPIPAFLAGLFASTSPAVVTGNKPDRAQP